MTRKEREAMEDSIAEVMRERLTTPNNLMQTAPLIVGHAVFSKNALFGLRCGRGA